MDYYTDVMKRQAVVNAGVTFRFREETSAGRFSTTDFREMDLGFLGENDLIYCDPPYLISTGSYNDGNRGFRDWHEEEEAALLGLLDRLNGQGTRFALSNVLYHKGLSNDLLIEWSQNYRYHLHR